MSAAIPDGKLEAVLQLLNQKFKVKALLSQTQYESVKDSLPQTRQTDESEERRRVIELQKHLDERAKNKPSPIPLPKDDIDNLEKRLRLVKAKAKALLRLLALRKDTIVTA
jgi:flagellar motility protein MotE (MotC chaperone)